MPRQFGGGVARISGRYPVNSKSESHHSSAVTARLERDSYPVLVQFLVLIARVLKFQCLQSFILVLNLLGPAFCPRR